MTEFDLLIDIHKDRERQGPGSQKETLRALDLIGLDKTKNLKIADIGCGSGSQTMVLAEGTQGHITAVDLFPDFLNKLEEQATKKGFINRISTVAKSMDELQFDDGKLDLIWSEGAIYNMGFENGVKEWRKFLKTGGYLAVSEISWITNSRPKEVEEHWNNEYPEIDTISNKIKVLEQNGYTPIAHFVLPQYCWIDNYYKPLQHKFESFLAKYNNSEMAQKIVALEKQEFEIYEKYKNYFSYGFYIAKKSE